MGFWRNCIFAKRAAENDVLGAALADFEEEALTASEVDACILPAEGLCGLLLLPLFRAYKREVLAERLKNLYLINVDSHNYKDKSASYKEYVKNHNNYVEWVASLYAAEKIDVNEFERHLKCAAKLYRSLTTQPSQIESACNEFELNTLAGNKSRRLCLDAKKALITSVKAAAAMEIVIGGIAICAAIQVAAPVAAFVWIMMTSSAGYVAGAAAIAGCLKFFPNAYDSVRDPRPAVSQSANTVGPTLVTRF